VGSVHGLGYVDVLRVELRRDHQAWLVDEINELRRAHQKDLAHWRARHDASPASPRQERSPEVREEERQLERLAYKLQVLTMIREQLPLGTAAAAPAVASPWHGHADDPAREPEPAQEPLAVVGPAAVITELIEAAARAAADALVLLR
jgi:hypothetical protein